MSQSSLLYAVVFFALGFVSGLVVAYIFGELRSGKSSFSESLSLPPASSLEPKKLPQHASVDIARPAASPDQQPEPSSLPSAAPLPAIDPGSESIKPVGLNPLNALLRSVPSATLKEKAKPKSMALEIDEILQHKLALSPLAGRYIRLQEQPDHRLLVLVDKTSFDGVSQVSDPEVRQLIQEAVVEWQRRVARGSP